MKHIRIFKLVILLFIVMISNISYSQGIVVYKKDGSKVKISYEKFDRIEVYTEEEDGNTTSDYNGHEYVDLGLSVKWATCNVGANSPEEYGKYYAWGELSTKDKYTENNCMNWNKYFSDISGDIRYDVATKDWGGNWRIPNENEFQELLDYCRWTWDEENAGYKVTSLINNNTIFIPAAGRVSESGPFQTGEGCCYWTSTPYLKHYAMMTLIKESEDGSTLKHVFFNYRSIGNTIRPVFD